MRFRFLFLALSAAFLIRPAGAADIEMTKVVLRGVDKITGRVKTIELKTGELASFGTLVLYPEKCLSHPPEETPENAVFLTISEPEEGCTHKIVFNGWMFSSNPALSAMDHPIYDIWVISCSSEKDASSKQEVPEGTDAEAFVNSATERSASSSVSRPSIPQQREQTVSFEEASSDSPTVHAMPVASSEEGEPAAAVPAAFSEDPKEPENEAEAFFGMSF